MQRDELLHLLLDRRCSILGWIAMTLHDRSAGEDVFQETLIRASAECEHFENAAHALAWVRGTARNLALNETRQAYRRAVSLDADVMDLLETEWASRDQRPADREELDRLERCLDRLGPTARTMVRLRFVDGLGGEAIALRVGKTIDAVHCTFSRLFKALATCLGGQPKAES